jgi:hypothetical protein
MSHRFAALFKRPSVVALLLAGALACAEREPRDRGQAASAPAVASPSENAAAARVVAAGPPMRLFASKYVSKIRAAPSKSAPRIGYMRGGAVLSAKTAQPLGFEACRKGWYELETGGFVCSTTDVTAFSGKRLPERRATPAVFDQPLPYPYGYSRSKNTPLYKRLPTDEEAAQYEGYKLPGAPLPEAALAPDEVAGVATSAVAPDLVSAPEASGAPGTGDVDAGGPPTLASLRGEDGSVLMRRMERGFYVSLDREISKGARSYWQTQAAGYIPKSRLWMVGPSEFRGVDLTLATDHPDALRLPLGFVMSSKTPAYTVDAKGRMRGAGKPGYHFAFTIASEVELRGKKYFLDANGVHYPQRELNHVQARQRPEGVGDDEKWIDVDLTSQSLVAYVGDKPVYATLVSSGRVKDERDPLRNFVTPTGEFRIASKHVTATMDGDHAVDGPYSIEDVPYVMYFQLAYALHSAFWHNSFGRPRSHGCINLAPVDAKWLFFWASPTLPKQWHGVYPGEADPGTRLFIRGETPKG